MSNKIIIFATLIFAFTSFTYLTIQENKQANLDSKNVWMVYFANPKDNSLDFTIENHTKNENFHWQILSGSDVSKEGDANISTGQTKSIPVTIPTDAIFGKKITISVTNNNAKKEIYKIF